MILQRLPLLVAGSLGLFLFGATLYPQQTFPEMALRWHYVLLLTAALAILGLLASNSKGRRRALVWVLPGITMATLWAACLTTWRGDFPWAGTDWMHTLVQAFAAAVVGVYLGQAGIAPRRLAFGVGAFAIALASFHSIDALHQLHVRFPETVEYLRQLQPRSDMDELILRASESGRVAARLGNPNVLAAVLCMLAPIAALALIAARGAATAAAAGVLVGLMAAVLLGTFSRGGLLTAAATCLGITLLMLWPAWRRRMISWRSLGIGLAVALGVMILLSISMARERQQLVSKPSERQSAQSPDDAAGGEASFHRPSTITMRLGFLEAGMAMVRDHALTGAGSGAFEALYPRYQKPGRQESKYAHAWPLQVVVENGIAGLFLLSMLMAVPVVAWRRFRHGLPADDNNTGDVAHLLIMPALALSALVFWLNGLVEITTYQREIMVLAMLTTGLLWGLAVAYTPEAPIAETQAPARLRQYLVSTLFVVFCAVPLVMVQARIMALSIVAQARYGPLQAIVETPADAWIDATEVESIQQAAQRATAFFPASPEPWLLLADAASILRQRAIAGRPMLDPHAPGSAELTTLLRDHISFVEEALKRSPTSASLHARLARVAPSPAEALQHIDRAIELHPNKPEHHEQRADLLESMARDARQRGDLDEAVSLLSEAIDQRREAFRIDFRSERMPAQQHHLRRLEADLTLWQQPPQAH
jgi:Ca2+/Na+ antiporter